jgi:hypothetical protein
MNRRDFFKAFAAIGVTAALAEQALVRAVTEPVPVLSSDSVLFSHAGDQVAYLQRVMARTTEGESRSARISILRTGVDPRVADYPIWVDHFNTLNGYMLVLPPMEEIAVARQHNARLKGDFDGVVRAQFHIEGRRGPVILTYAMLRERDPQLRSQILMLGQS